MTVYVKWEAKIRHIPYAWAPSRPWGPTAEDIAGCHAATYNPSMMSGAELPTDQLFEDYASDGEDILSETDDELLMGIEEMALAEEYSIGQGDEGEFTEGDEWLEDIENGYLPSSPIQIPAKRWRY